MAAPPETSCEFVQRRRFVEVACFWSIEWVPLDHVVIFVAFLNLQYGEYSAFVIIPRSHGCVYRVVTVLWR